MSDCETIDVVSDQSPSLFRDVYPSERKPSLYSTYQRGEYLGFSFHSSNRFEYSSSNAANTLYTYHFKPETLGILERIHT